MQHLVGAASRKELCDLCRSWIPRDRHLKMLSCQDHDDDESISQVDEETQKKALQTCLCLCQRVRQKKVWCMRKDLLWQKSALFVPSAKPAFTVPATRLRPARYLPRTTSVCTLNRYRSLSLFDFTGPGSNHKAVLAAGEAGGIVRGRQVGGAFTVGREMGRGRQTGRW
jgi:hypothetical protein